MIRRVHMVEPGGTVMFVGGCERSSTVTVPTFRVHYEEVTLRGSYVAGTIADFARTLPATLLATNTSGRGGIARVVLGSVAMGVVSLAPCPVLVTPSP